MSKENALSHNLQLVDTDTIKVRLADGQHVSTTAHTITQLKVGDLYLQQRFEILNENVATILGMPFLEATNPQINWKRKSLRIKHKGKYVNVPTVRPQSSQQQQQQQDLYESSNQYADLPIEEGSHDIDDNNNYSNNDNMSQIGDIDIMHSIARNCEQRVVTNAHVSLSNALSKCSSLTEMLQLCATFDEYNPPSTAQFSKLHTTVAAQQPVQKSSKSKIETVSLHAFMRGMKAQQYQQSFVMIGSDLFDDNQPKNVQSSEKLHKGTGAIHTTLGHIDTSSIPQHVKEQCKLVGGVRTAVLALLEANKYNVPVANLSCPHCNFPHLDTEATCHTQTRVHVCKNAMCTKQYKNTSGAYGNPLAAFSVQYVKNQNNQQNNNIQFTPNPQAHLNYIHRHAHGTQGQSDKTSLSTLADSTMKSLKAKFPSVFTEPTYPVDRPAHQQHQIKLLDPSAPPPKRRLYPLSDSELQELKEQVELFLSTNRIRPSSSPYGAPILFARKKDGKLRMCIDYRALNSQTVPDSFPLPRIDELLARIQGARYFSKLDLRDGYHQIPVASDSQPLTAFTCRYGTFEWLVMPFGLSNAPGTFQRVMNDVFFKLLDQGVLVYLDDILIYTKTADEHTQLIHRVFDILHKNKLYIKESKCALFLEHVEFLGHVISADGVSVESGKTDAIKNWPVPTNVNEVQQFMGLANYYRKFIFKFSDIAQPLTSLTRKNVIFNWTDLQQKAFDKIKQLLCSAPVLKVFDASLPTRIICDASDFAIGSVLEQQHDSDKWHPVEFISKSLNSAERNYSATDREFVAVRYSLEKWQHLLANREFVIYTDHAALTYLQSTSHVSRRNARWLEFLSQFRFTMLHVRGDSNVADHLSRISQVSSRELAQLGAFISVFDKPALFDAIKIAQSNCTEDWYQKLVQKANQQANQRPSDFAESSAPPHQHKRNDPTVQFRNDMLCLLIDDYFCPVVPRESGIHLQILRDLHSSSLGGHLGFLKLYNLVRKRFYWANMRNDIDAFCRACPTCQTNKTSTQKPAGLLQPLPIPNTCFESISMDFITHLPISNGYDCIFTIVDRFSKFVRFIPMRTTDDAPHVAQLLFDHWICLYGMPRVIVSDRDSRFTSRFWQSLMRLLDCKTAMSTAFHPQTDGQTERFHRTVEQVLRCFCSDNHNRWCNVLQQCGFALNSTHHQGTTHSPFYTVFLRHPRLPLDAALDQLQDETVEAVDQLLRDRHAVDQSVTSHLRHANDYAARYANTKRRPLSFQPGDQVLLATTNLALPPGFTKKLAPKWLGPMPVVRAVGKVAYEVALPTTLRRLHPVFHVSLLKPWVGAVPPARPPVFTTPEEEEFEVERIQAHRVVRRKRQFLVVWKGYPAHDATWEPEENLSGAPTILQKYKQDQGLD